MKPLYSILGLVFVGIGIVGIALPVLPSTPFFLLAAYLFSKSSPRLNRWLHEHPQFGPPLCEWERHGTIRPRAKWLAAICIGLSFLMVTFVGSRSAAVKAVAYAGLLGALIFILTRPSRPRPT